MRVLVACFPKSGSTFLANVIGGLPEFKVESYVPDHERREQELCDTAIGKCTGLHQVAQLHVRASWSTLHLIDKWNINTIVLVRNIYDAIVSLTDHIARESPAFPHAWFNETTAALPFERRLAAVVELAGPWFFNFYVSWWFGRPEAIVRYEDLVLGGPKRQAEFLVSRGIATCAEDVAASLARIDPVTTRLNVGKAGRGGTLLSPEQREWIANLTRHYSDVDFTPIGLPNRGGYVRPATVAGSDTPLVVSPASADAGRGDGRQLGNDRIDCSTCGFWSAKANGATLIRACANPTSPMHKSWASQIDKCNGWTKASFVMPSGSWPCSPP